MSARTWVKDNDLILWGALGCALVGTAHAEYTLALSVGANQFVAGAVPGALDLYVIRALQQGRDVFVAVLVMVAANVASYLVHSGDVPVDWRLRSAVGALAPLILWRVYSLRRTRTRKELLWGLRPGAGSASVPEDAPVPYLVHPSLLGCVWGHAECTGAGKCTVYSSPDTAPDHVPDWVTEGRVHPSAPEDAPRYETSAPTVTAPEVEVHLDAGTSAPVELTEADQEYLPKAREYIASIPATERPTIRGMREYVGIGQKRAQVLLAYLETEES